MIDDFRILDVGQWPVEAREERGKRDKFWIRAPDGTRWLRKDRLTNRPAESTIEVLMLRLGRAVGLDVPVGDCATWVVEGKSARGAVVLTFIPDDKMEFSEGAQILGGADLAYDPENYPAHTPARVFAALGHERFGAAGDALRAALLDILIFDAWVGNGDRHPGNWGILMTPDMPPRIAPMYDTAACLGAELLDGHALLQPSRRSGRLQKYIDKCGSGFGDGKTVIGQTLLVQELKKWPAWQERVGYWLGRFERILTEAIPYIERLPDDWLGPERKWLAQELLQRRLQWIRERA